MSVSRLSLGLAAVVLAACSATTTTATLEEPAVAPPPPGKAVMVGTENPTLVPYPGLEVSYVANAGGEVYFQGGRFYCYHRGDWFRSAGLDDDWRHVQMKYVPTDLFRVRGHLPPGLKRHNAPKVRLVSDRKPVLPDPNVSTAE